MLAAMPSKLLRSKKTQSVFLNAVHPPYRAVLGKQKPGEWRKHIEEAMADARAMSRGARVFSSEGVLLAKFDSAAKFAGEARRGPGRPGRSSFEEN